MLYCQGVPGTAGQGAVGGSRIRQGTGSDPGRGAAIRPSQEWMDKAVGTGMGQDRGVWFGGVGFAS